MTGGYTFNWKPKPKCAGCGGKVKRPVHPGNRGSIYCSASCRKYHGQLKDEATYVTPQQQTFYIEPKEQMHKDFPVGIDKPGLIAAFESRVRAGDEAAPKIYNALAQSLQPGVTPHEWCFNRNQECYWCPKCGAVIELAMVQHYDGPPDEMFKGRCRGMPTVEKPTVGHDWAPAASRGGDSYQCRKCKAFYRANANQEMVDRVRKSLCPEWAVPERPGRVIKFEEEV